MGKGGNCPSLASRTTFSSRAPHTSLAVHGQRCMTCAAHAKGHSDTRDCMPSRNGTPGQRACLLHLHHSRLHAVELTRRPGASHHGLRWEVCTHAPRRAHHPARNEELMLHNRADRRVRGIQATHGATAQDSGRQLAVFRGCCRGFVMKVCPTATELVTQNLGSRQFGGLTWMSKSRGARVAGPPIEANHDSARRVARLRLGQK